MRTKVLHTFLLIITPKASVISVIFRGEHRKNDAKLLSTFTIILSNRGKMTIILWVKVNPFASFGRTDTSKGKVKVKDICLNISFLT